ncbi:bacteriophage abortive infection AbiH family protein [Elizabethkingia anophelis]|uniref:bacteriophage abortive infection AbiH family protein n=1 Tax=Elizabethkingia anophelis TaxID=1117645 RepID=UPI001626EF8A|nr:bacteriophage abortive infection AbiH family protein [Elizabethkingia anophelis]
MAIKKLYIIGNGFDMQHGIKSKYSDFREYIETKDERLKAKLEEYFDSDVLWSNFEEALADLDTEQIVEECSDYLYSYDTEDWSDSYNHDYQYELQQRINLITNILKQHFTEWILQLEIPENAEENMVIIDRGSRFINFNYTDTLEQLYKIAQHQIFYIHNKAINTESTLILGHSRIPQETKKTDDEDYDVRVAEGNQILNKYFADTYKSTETIIKENTIFFSGLNTIETIYVFGHSLSVVDRPYFEEIIKHINKEEVTWKVSFYSKTSISGFEKFFQELGIDLALVEFDRMYNFDKEQLELFPKDK